MKEKVVVIDAVREVYDPRVFVGKHPGKWSMKVNDLLVLLEDMDPEARVILSNDGGRTYGCVWFDRITEAVVDPETGRLTCEFE